MLTSKMYGQQMTKCPICESLNVSNEMMYFADKNIIIEYCCGACWATWKEFGLYATVGYKDLKTQSGLSVQITGGEDAY